ncbi:MAG: right-handed parallel beta-helix repeat-containing protein, partial [Thermoplasmatales archaeon]|nr:right-handed parallel beta-helix repeat-containing protein [Thermoplasmatales archaeon]
MKYSLFKKGLVVVIIILFVGVSIVPSISGNILKLNSLDDEKRELNAKYINPYNTPGDANDLFITEDCVYVVTDKFGLYDYTYLNDDSNYDQSDNHQFLEFRRIERPYKASNTEKLDNNFGIKNKVISRESNHATFDKVTLKPSILNSGNTFYVGGLGPNNYTSIQDAIDTASDGDIVFVYDDSSPYYENITIDKSINMIGEDKDSTIIDGSKLDSSLDTVSITADNVYIDGFSINNNLGYYYQAAIMIIGDYATVSNCKIHDNNWIGISLLGSSYSQIFDCELYNNLMAIHLIDSNENEIKDCLCYGNSEDILLFQTSHNNQIINCTCIENSFSGIHIQRSSG